MTARGPVDVLANGRALRAPTEPLRQRPGVWWVPRAGRLDVTVTDDGWTWQRSWTEDGGTFDPANESLTTRRGSPECGDRSDILLLEVTWQAGLAVPTPSPDLLWCGESGLRAVALLALPAPGGGQVLLGIELVLRDGTWGLSGVELATTRAAGDPLAQGLAWRRPDGGLVLVGPAGSERATLVRAGGGAQQRVDLADGGALVDQSTAPDDATGVVFIDAAGATLAACDVTVAQEDPFTALGAPSPRSTGP